VIDGLFADNRLSLDIDRADVIKVQNTQFIGKSESFGNWQRAMRIPNACGRDNGAVVGVELHTWKNDPADDGVVFDNVTFTGFSNNPCLTTVPISIDDTVNLTFAMQCASRCDKLDVNSRCVLFSSRRSRQENSIYIPHLRRSASSKTLIQLTSAEPRPRGLWTFVSQILMAASNHPRASRAALRP
jgi:hypothetical protein